MTYRLNFVLWRVRMVMQLLIAYFLWSALYTGRAEIFGYQRVQMFTYLLLTAVVRTLVLGTTTLEIGRIINEGNLSNYLLKPISFMKFYAAKDVADKALNFAFSIFEISAVILILKPDVSFQISALNLFLFACAVFFAVTIYFFFSLLVGFFGFWLVDVWSVRFLIFVVMEFFTGSLFPLDIMPNRVQFILKLFPFYYLLYFPVKVYLGTLTMPDLISGFVSGLIWITVLYVTVRFVWIKGLKSYTAYGR